VRCSLVLDSIIVPAFTILHKSGKAARNGGRLGTMYYVSDCKVNVDGGGDI